MQKQKLYMAPMKGLTDHLFRTAFADHFGGFDLAIAPFISSKRDHSFKLKYVRDVLPENNPTLPVIPQILSNVPDDFMAITNYLFDLGYGSVNWNLGCPSRTVISKKRGAGMLPHTDLIRTFLDDTFSGIKGAISVKLRLGWSSAEDIYRLLPVLNQYPLELVIIHPRTGIQQYEGEIDLSAFEQCLSVLKHPVVYNGDIRTYDDFKRLSRRYESVSQWMIGRGCLADPFLPSAIKTGDTEVPNRIGIIKQFHDDLFEKYSRVLHGPSHLLNRMKGIWRYLSFSLKGNENFNEKVYKTQKLDQYRGLVNQYFESDHKYGTKAISLPS
jgi:tRNA-dihydrouridine synthase